MKWSPKFDACRHCGTTQTEHYACGLCKDCFDVALDKTKPATVKDLLDAVGATANRSTATMDAAGKETQ